MGILKKRGFLEGIDVRGMDGEPRKLSELWRSETVILKVLHRMACPLCRYESRLLSDLKPSLDDLNVRLVGVGFEDLGLQDFIDGKFWEWELFLDPARSVHMALGLLRGGLVSRVAHRLGLSNGRMTRCGTFVISPTEGVVYEYRQKGQRAAVKDIFALVGGNPDLVVESSPADYLFDLKSTRTSPTFRTNESKFSFNE